jgi:hypothetical protein
MERTAILGSTARVRILADRHPVVFELQNMRIDKKSKGKIPQMGYMLLPTVNTHTEPLGLGQ